MAKMTFDFPPAEVVEFFRTYFGPTKMAFGSLEPEKQEELRKELEDLWTSKNTASEGKTLVLGEYLAVVAVKK